MADEDEETPSRKRMILTAAAIVVPVVVIVAYLAFFRSGPRGFEVDTVPAGGTVLLNGKPKAGIRVTYHPQFDVGPVKFTPNGTTDVEGKFTLGSARPFDGAPPGEYLVTFELPYLKNGAIEEEGDLLKGKYKDPAKSTWKVTVAANSQESFQLN